MVGAIIGRGGSTIRNITQQSRARVDVHRYSVLEMILPEDNTALTLQLPQDGALAYFGEGHHCVRPARELQRSLQEDPRGDGGGG